MALKRKYSICAWFFLLLGLVSCSQDKEINYQPSPVTGFHVGALDSEKKMQWAEDINELELGGELTIDILKNPKRTNNPVTVRVQSWCKADTASSTAYNEIHFQDRLSIPVLNILSADALLSTSSQPLVCRIVLNLTDAFSSQRIYNLEEVKIKNSAEFNNIPFFKDNHTVFYKDLKDTPLLQGQQRLVCDDFSKSPDNSVQNWEQLITSSALETSTWSSSVQKCRLLIKNNEDIVLSSPFTLVFPQQELLTRATLHPFSEVAHLLDPRQVITLHVTNPNPFTVRLKVQNLRENRMYFVPVYVGLGAVGYIGHQRDFPFVWSLQDTSHLKSSTDNEWGIELPAQQEIVINGFFQGKLNCDTEIRPTPLVRHMFHNHPNFVGIHYGFDFKIQFQTHLIEDQWQSTSLQQDSLAPMVAGERTFWNLFYDQLRAQYGKNFRNPAKNTEEFINTVRWDVVYDRCRVL